MLHAIDLHKQFPGHTALAGVSLQVRPGELYCLLGANGAGKTTTINCFLGLIRPDRGQVLINGQDVQVDRVAARRQVAYIPEHVTLYGNLTGAENLAYFVALSGGALDAAAQQATLARVGLDAAASARRLATYSKGMRQKVGVAIALARGTRALLLDEPTSGLDPQAANEFSHLLALLREEGVAMLMATHDLFRARQDGTRIGIMRHGTLRQELDAASVTAADLEQIYLAQMAV